MLVGDDGHSVVGERWLANIYTASSGLAGDLVNVGYHTEYDDEEEIVSTVNDARVDRAFWACCCHEVGGDASIGVMDDYILATSTQRNAVVC